jgi:hypothetical protein
MKKIALSLLAAAAAAATVALPATAHAEDNRQTFQSPSGNIRCAIGQADGASAHVNCQLQNITYNVPVEQAHDDNGAPCPGDYGSGRDLRLVQGQAGFIRCSYAALDGGVGPWPTLSYGDSISLNAITCDSAPAALTCTDTTTGHFFRVSRDFYDLG